MAGPDARRQRMDTERIGGRLLYLSGSVRAQPRGHREAADGVLDDVERGQRNGAAASEQPSHKVPSCGTWARRRPARPRASTSMTTTLGVARAVMSDTRRPGRVEDRPGGRGPELRLRQKARAALFAVVTPRVSDRPSEGLVRRSGPPQNQFGTDPTLTESRLTRSIAKPGGVIGSTFTRLGSMLGVERRLYGDNANSTYLERNDDMGWLARARACVYCRPPRTHSQHFFDLSQFDRTGR